MALKQKAQPKLFPHLRFKLFDSLFFQIYLFFFSQLKKKALDYIFKFIIASRKKFIQTSIIKEDIWFKHDLREVFDSFYELMKSNSGNLTGPQNIALKVSILFNFFFILRKKTFEIECCCYVSRFGSNICNSRTE